LKTGNRRFRWPIVEDYQREPPSILGALLVRGFSVLPKGVGILLLCNRSQGHKRTIAQVAESALCSIGTVRNVKNNYFVGGLESALYEKSRPGPVPTFTGETEAHLTMLACSEPPEGYGRWTLRLLADKMVGLEYLESISHVTVGEILKKTNCNLGE